MKSNALVLMAVLVVTYGALLPEVKPQDDEATRETKSSPGEPAQPHLAQPAGAPEKAEDATPTPDRPNVKISPGLAEVIKLVEGGVNSAVVEAYIQNSQIAYYPSADEILQLHNMGVSQEIISALMRRGSQVRAQQAQAFKESQERQAQPMPAPPPPAPAPSVIVVQPPQPAPQPVSYDYYVNSYPSYSYGFPYYSSFGYAPYRYSYFSPLYSSFSYSYVRYNTPSFGFRSSIACLPRSPHYRFSSVTHPRLHLPSHTSIRTSSGHSGTSFGRGGRIGRR